jgi:hypothetical protein
MVQMLQPDFGVGVPAGFVSLILATICIWCNVSFKSSLWRFLCNSKDIYVYLWSYLPNASELSSSSMQCYWVETWWSKTSATPAGNWMVVCTTK